MKYDHRDLRVGIDGLKLAHAWVDEVAYFIGGDLPPGSVTSVPRAPDGPNRKQRRAAAARARRRAR